MTDLHRLTVTLTAFNSVLLALGVAPLRPAATEPFIKIVTKDGRERIKP
jgi:hypothetical protein